MPSGLQGGGRFEVRCVMIEEQDEQLEAEVAAFFAVDHADCRNGTWDFQEAALCTFERE